MGGGQQCGMFRGHTDFGGHVRHEIYDTSVVNWTPLESPVYFHRWFSKCTESPTYFYRFAGFGVVLPHKTFPVVLVRVSGWVLLFPISAL